MHFRDTGYGNRIPCCKSNRLVTVAIGQHRNGRGVYRFAATVAITCCISVNVTLSLVGELVTVTFKHCFPVPRITSGSRNVLRKCNGFNGFGFDTVLEPNICTLTTEQARK